MSQANVLFDAPGPKTLVRNRIIGVIAVTILLVLIGLLFWGLRGQFTVDKVAILFQPITWTSSIIPGLINTLQAAEISIVTALVLGILLGVGRLSDLAPVRWLCSLIVEFFRAVPVLVMMIFTYQLIIQVLLPLGLVIDSAVISLTSVVVGLTLYNAAVIAELLRSGMHALPKGQREAGLAIGLSSSQTRWAILLPQAITAMLPSLVSQLVVVLKDSALGSIVLYPELLRSMNTLASNNGNTVAALTLGALLYIIINFGLTNFAGFVEKKASRRTAGRIARVARKA
ncbi:amino acid ABC transporter permease [Granulicoccus phenolivorans]|uniref:amino acid ABC transporter permease n=1 Tax=Granulicoccus phenolivorans TaxID=266854 RepID=UPI00040FAE27|nr:amino acid ABC transporter permease [Granulicoccus phenolivorans]